MIQSFLNYLQFNRGLSANTLIAYRNDLRDFARFVNEYYTGTRWSTVTKQQIDAFVASMSTNGYEPATIKQHISTLRTFFKTCRAMGAEIANPAQYVSTPKVANELPKCIEHSAIMTALESEKTEPQAKALIALIYETGLRLQEVLDLDGRDIDEQQHTMIVKGKGNKERKVYFGELTEKYFLGIWRFGEHQQRECRRLVYEALRRYSQAKQLSPHAIRHTFATTMANNGARIETISTLLGHRYTTTTQRYARLGTATIRQEYEANRPQA
jgi:site-specific recombinase XerD